MVHGGVSPPSFSDILSISRGIFKWLRQQQVVNPFFKGSTATVRFEVARVKRTPSGDLLVSFTLSLTAASFRPRQALFIVPFPPKLPSRREPANLCTFSNHAVSFPVPSLPPLSRIPRLPLHGLRREGKKGFPVIGNSLARSYTSSFEFAQRAPLNEFIRFPSGTLAGKERLPRAFERNKTHSAAGGARSSSRGVVSFLGAPPKLA